MNTVKFGISIFVLVALLSCDSVSEKIQQKVEDKVNEKIDKTIDDAMNKLDTAMNNMSLDSLTKMTKGLDSTINKKLQSRDKDVQKLQEKSQEKPKDKK